MLLYTGPKFFLTTSRADEENGCAYRAIDRCKFYGPEACPLK